MSSLISNVGYANPSNAHNSGNMFSSKVGGVSGCGGPLNSPEALNGTGMFNMVKTGGKRNGHKSRRKYRGGGYGFGNTQLPIAATSGVHGAHRAVFNKYDNIGVDSDTNMGASSQSGGNGYSYGTGGYPYYSYKPSDGENLSAFAGSGYPPITRGLNSQCGGKTKKSKRKAVKKNKRSTKKSKRKAIKKKKRNTKKRKSHKQKGGYSQYGSDIANTHTYSVGGQLNNSNSALANPPPYTSTNDCLNTWKHLGDTPPYNKIYV